MCNREINTNIIKKACASVNVWRASLTRKLVPCVCYMKKMVNEALN